jgi:hypothetical protein
MQKMMPTTERMNAARGLPPNKVSKKHIRANSSINHYASN